MGNEMVSGRGSGEQKSFREGKWGIKKVSERGNGE